MKRKITNIKYSCKDYYNRAAMILLLICSCVVFTALAYVLYDLFAKESCDRSEITVMFFLIALELAMIVICAIDIALNRTCIFTITVNEISLVGKKRGKEVYIVRDIDQIESIVVKYFAKIKVIVLVDIVGKIGNGGISQNGEFIKLRYSKKRLEIIQKALPNCPVIKSDNARWGELF